LKKVIAALACAGAFLLVGAAGATDDGVWLFPASHGTGTIAAWRAQEGEADDQGVANQAVLLEKDVAAADTSAAAHVVGVEGQQVRFLVSLAYEYRVKDGVCGVTDPRWALFVRGQSGREYVVNLGCKLTPSAPGAEPGWIRKNATQAFIRAETLRKGGTDAFNGEVTGLALVFDRIIGHVFVDNIRVQTRLVRNVWTFAGDNGGTTPPGGPSFTANQSGLLAAPLSANEQLTADDLLATLTLDESAVVNADADPTG
jgi:hypothetical protein